LGADVFLANQIGIVNEGAALTVGRKLAGSGVLEALDNGLLGRQASAAMVETK
jgi:hypothetical protein